MLLTIFLIFLGLGLVLTIAGFTLDIPLITFTGCIIIFLVGFNLLGSPLQVPSGENAINFYGTNLTSNGLEATTDTPYILNTTTTQVYTSFDDSSTHYAFYIMMLGALTLAVALFNL